MMRFKKVFLICLLLGLCMNVLQTLPKSATINTGNNEDSHILNDTIKIAMNIYQMNNEIDSIKNELIGEVENYIFKRFPKVNRNLPTLIVENGLEHNIDIAFMMAQAKIETCFGTAGAGRESSRRSLFGVALRTYSSYDKAIKDYISILKKSYLRNGRTEQHLMQKYTTISGYRYAGSTRYEPELRLAYMDINKKTNIRELQNKYKKTNNK